MGWIALGCFILAAVLIVEERWRDLDADVSDLDQPRHWQ